MALIRIHTSGLIETQAEKLVVEHLYALQEGSMHAGVRVPHPVAVLRLRCVVLRVVPPLVGDDLGRVAPGEDGRLHEEDVACTPAKPDSAPPDCNLLSAMVHVVGDAHHFAARNGLQFLFCLYVLFHEPHGVGEPPAQRLRNRCRGEVCLLSSQLGVAVDLHEKAAESVRHPSCAELVRQHVRSKQYPHTWPNIECVASRYVVERLQFQDSRTGAEEVDAHEPVPLEDVQPPDAVLGRELSWRHVGALPCFEQIPRGARAQLKAEILLRERLHG
mmetsp:Transcript_88817/g.281077  ORF Transcript_88817/g.281077 Transcript_88817/m.281077 type:complete len:274 (+) Transcript_88817:2420-3241(+)